MEHQFTLPECTGDQKKELRSRILGVPGGVPWTEEDTARMENMVDREALESLKKDGLTLLRCPKLGKEQERIHEVVDMETMSFLTPRIVCETCGSTVSRVSYIRAPPNPSEEALEYARKLEEGKYELETLGLDPPDEHPVFDPNDVNRLFEKPRIENSLRFIFTCVFTGGRTHPYTINIVSIGMPNNILLGAQQLSSSYNDSDFKQPLIDHINRIQQQARIVLCVEAGTGFFPQTVQDIIKKEFGSRVICMNDEGIIGLRATFESNITMVHTTHMYLQLGYFSIWEGVTGALDKLKAELIEYKCATKETTGASVYTGGDLAFTFQFCVYAIVWRFFVEPKYSRHHI